MNATMKIMINFIFIVLLFFINTWLGYGVMLAMLLFTCAIIKMPFVEVLKFMLKLCPILLFTAMMNVFFVSGNAVFTWGIIKISQEGIEFAIKMVARIICLILAGKILVYTTTPLELAKRYRKYYKTT